MTYNLHDFMAYQSRLHQGPITASEHRAEFERMLAAKETFVDHLTGNYNAEFLQFLALRQGVRDAQQQTMDENARGIFNSLLQSFILGRTVGESPVEIGIDEAVVAKLVRNITDKELSDDFLERQFRDDTVANALRDGLATLAATKSNPSSDEDSIDSIDSRDSS